jgi:hypothetical protein
MLYTLKSVVTVLKQSVRTNQKTTGCAEDKVLPFCTLKFWNSVLVVGYFSLFSVHPRIYRKIF